MEEKLVLGIDAGGTHTDAALLALGAEKEGGGAKRARLLASAKVPTRHEDLPFSVCAVLRELSESRQLKALGGMALLRKLERVTLGTTLAINALIQGRADKVGLALAAGPGISPKHFALGEYVCIVPGGLDHRGEEVSTLDLSPLERKAHSWPAQGVRAIACVGKFSPRNPAQEERLAEVARRESGLSVCMGHSLSGRLNFPRRIATAYYNAAVSRLHNGFLSAVAEALASFGIEAEIMLLKADGGAIPGQLSRREPVQSILSGPAASVMGVLALWPKVAEGCTLLLDMGGTTTDLALFFNDSPLIDRDGMQILGRRTLVRALASTSIGIGGDSRLFWKDQSRRALGVGPERYGAAMAFGGAKPTLLDALNVLDAEAKSLPPDCGDASASRRGLEELAREGGGEADKAVFVAEEALALAEAEIAQAANALVQRVNSKPIYTLAGLRSVTEARPVRACIVGGPAARMCKRLEKSLGLPLEVADYADVANAIGAALTRPTASLDLYADTGRRELRAPALGIVERIASNFSLEQAKERACALLDAHLRAEGIEDAKLEIVEAEFYATLDVHGRGAREMRVSVQVRPGIAGRLWSQDARSAL